MNKPKVSVLIVSYNQVDFIKEALDGAINQNYPSLEVVVSDDGSTDGTAQVIAAYQKKHPDVLIAILNERNLGITANSNIGLAKCTGKYIAFTYGDDILLPGKILAQVQWFESDPTRVLCGHRAEVFSRSTARSYKTPLIMRQGVGADLLIRSGGLYPATSIMVRSKSIPPHGFEPSIPTVTDYMMCIEVLASGGSYGYIRGTYARYRRHERNITNQREKILDDVERTLLIVKDRYPILKNSCEFARLKHVVFERAMIDVRAGRFKCARIRLLEVMSNGRLSVRALRQYFLSFFIQVKVKLAGR